MCVCVRVHVCIYWYIYLDITTVWQDDSLCVRTYSPMHACMCLFVKCNVFTVLSHPTTSFWQLEACNGGLESELTMQYRRLYSAFGCALAVHS